MQLMTFVLSPFCRPSSTAADTARPAEPRNYGSIAYGKITPEKYDSLAAARVSWHGDGLEVSTSYAVNKQMVQQAVFAALMAVRLHYLLAVLFVLPVRSQSSRSFQHPSDSECIC